MAWIERHLLTYFKVREEEEDQQLLLHGYKFGRMFSIFHEMQLSLLKQDRLCTLIEAEFLVALNRGILS